MRKLTDGEKLEIALVLMGNHPREMYEDTVAYCEKKGRSLFELTNEDQLEILRKWVADIDERAKALGLLPED